VVDGLNAMLCVWMWCFFFLVDVVFVFTLVLAVVVNRICFVFNVESCPLLFCFVYYVLFECVVTLCMCYLSAVSYCYFMCYLSVESYCYFVYVLLVCCVLLLYYCHRPKTQLQLNTK
jgi:hypothetical protein